MLRVNKDVMHFVNRRQIQKCHKISKKSKIIEFNDYIRNHRGKCIQISTNMPSIEMYV